MKRHLNYTGRARITRDQAMIRIREEQVDDRPVFDLRLRLRHDSGYPDYALVRVEANRSNAVQRWDFGTVGDIVEPTLHQRRLTDVESTSYFRVFIVEPETSRLLGLADRIRPIQPIDSLVLLREDDGTKLGKEVWRVDFEEDESPILLINSNVPKIGDIVLRDKVFRSLVMPQVLRQVLTQIAFVDQKDPDDNEETWATEWFDFVGKTLGIHANPDMAWGASINPEQAQAWIDRAVDSFSDKSVRAVRSYSEAVGG